MRRFFLILSVLLLWCCGCWAGGHYLIQDGQSAYSIVLADDAIAAEQTAAEELQHHLQAMCGVELPIIHAADYTSGPMVAVGFNGHLPQALQEQAYARLGEEELVIDVEGDTLLLAGGRPRGTLYAVYEFLFRNGIRWYTPEYTKIPDMPTVPLPKEPYRYTSPVPGRKMNSGNRADNAWRARTRLTCNTLWAPLGEEYGSTTAEGPDMHTFWRLVSKSTLNAHPDWLVEIDGKREKAVGTTWGLCLGNEDVRQYLIARTIDYAKKHPDKKTIWIGQNDGSRYCTCKKCEAFYDAHGGEPSSIVVQLVNELSDALAKHVPGCKVKTLAYSWSLMPPENMTVRDNVMVMFCPAGNWFQSIETDPERKAMREGMAAWRKLVKHIDVYLYFPHEDYWSPGPCTYVGAENIKWCVENGANNLYVAVSGHGNSFGSESVHLRSWVYNRLMWDPTLDTQQLIDDFVTGYYGDAAPLVKQAITWTHENIYDENGLFKEHPHNSTVPSYVDAEVVRRVNELFEKNYDALPDDIYKKHFRYAWIPYLWADFWLGFQKIGCYDHASQTWSVPMEQGERRNRYGRMIKQFMAEHGINALKELRKFNPRDLGLDKMGKAWPAALLAEDEVQAVIVPGVGGKVCEFRRGDDGFAPLKEYWRGLAYEYPLISTTQETVNGRQITDYVLDNHTDDAVNMHADAGAYRAKKDVMLREGVLTTRFIVDAKKAVKLSCTNCVMFDLAEGVFGFYPILYQEKTDGTWTSHVVGSETDFHWIERNIDLADCTGRLVLQRQDNAQGVLMTVQPEQLKNLYFWYSRYLKDDPAHCGMMRFFINSPAVDLNSGEQISLTWSLEILPDVASVVGEAAVQ